MVVKIFDEINLDEKRFREVNLKEFNDFYLIGIKDKESKEVSSITFEIAIDSGVKGKPLHLPNIKLDLEKEVSGVRCTNHPSVFYIRPVQVITADGKAVKEGKFDVEININALDLG